jgi:hypothetical protein
MPTKLWGIAFPSIVEGLGADRVMAEAAEMGQSEFILCSIIYKGYRLVMPRHPRQIYSLETGVTFYPACESAYQGCDIRPASSRDYAGHDYFQEMADAGARHGVGLSAWVSCFANGRVAMDYPQHAVQNLYGSRDRLFLCVNDPEVQKYILAMFTDLVTRYPLTSVMADKIPQTTLELDGFGGRIDPLLRMTGSICFCEHCKSQAQKDGIDLKAAQVLALELGEAARKMPQHVREALKEDLKGDTEIPLFLIENPLFAEVLRWRVDCAVRFLAQVRTQVRSIQPEIKVSAALVPPVKIGHDAASPRAWLGAQSYQKFAQVLDTLHCIIHWDVDVVAYDTRRARTQVDASGSNCELCVHVAGYGPRRPEDVKSLAVAALSQGADSVCFFCHDLFDDPMIAALKALKGQL